MNQKQNKLIMDTTYNENVYTCSNHEEWIGWTARPHCKSGAQLPSFPFFLLFRSSYWLLTMFTVLLLITSVCSLQFLLQQKEMSY